MHVEYRQGQAKVAKGTQGNISEEWGGTKESSINTAYPEGRLFHTYCWCQQVWKDGVDDVHAAEDRNSDRKYSLMDLLKSKKVSSTAKQH